MRYLFALLIRRGSQRTPVPLCAADREGDTPPVLLPVSPRPECWAPAPADLFDYGPAVERLIEVHR